MTEDSRITKRGELGHHQGSRRVPGAAQKGGAPGTLLAALGGPPRPPFAYKTPRGWKPLNRTSFRQKQFRSPPPSPSSFGGQNPVPAPCRDGEVPPDSSPSMLLPFSMMH